MLLYVEQYYNAKSAMMSFWCDFFSVCVSRFIFRRSFQTFFWAFGHNKNKTYGGSSSFFSFELAATKQQIKIWFSNSQFPLLLLFFSSFVYKNKVTNNEEPSRQARIKKSVEVYYFDCFLVANISLNFHLMISMPLMHLKLKSSPIRMKH